MTAPTQTAGRHGVQALNFFVAALQTGFGPFVSVWLFGKGWSDTDVGVALSVGTIAGLLAQLPGGVLVDAIHRKRNVAAAALAVLAISALAMAATPSTFTVWTAEILHAAASAVIGPAIAALTLSLCGHDEFSDRLGANARYASLGSALAAVSFGVVSTYVGERGIFLLTAVLALPAAASLLAIGPADPPMDHKALVPMKERDVPPWGIFREPLMHVFAISVILFQLVNAALLPLALGRLSHQGRAFGFVVPVAIVVPQLIVAAASPWAGSMARRIGRRTVLLVGFAALPLRALAFAAAPGPEALDALQVLDGVSATVLGIMLPLIAADLTRNSGHLNLAMGSFGLAAGLGATFGTAIGGWVADRMGLTAAFFGLALVGLAAMLLLAMAMPETRPPPRAGA